VNIWWINHHARPPVVPGGTRHYNLAKELKKLGHRTTVINGTFDHLGPLSNKGDATYSGWRPLKKTYDGVPFFSVPTPRYSGNASFGRIWNMVVFTVKTVKIFGWAPPTEKPDVIVGSTVHPLAAFAGLILSRIHRVPFVYEVRDLWPLTLVELGKISPRHPAVAFFGLLDRVLARSASTILITAPLMYKYYQERYSLPKDRFLWVTNGSDLSFSERTTLSKGKPSIMQIGYSGTLGEANGVFELIKALNNTPEEILKAFQLHIIGDGPQKDRIKRAAARSRFNVVFHDPVPKMLLSEKLSRFDLLLVILQPSPIYRYGISLNKLADYHKVGKPIVMVGKCAANPLDLSHAGFKVESLEELPLLLRKVCTTPASELARMGENGMIYAEKNYEWSSLAKKLEKRLTEITR